MSLDEVASKVTEKGKRESNQILKEAGQQSLQILNKAEKEAKAIVAEARDKAEKQIKLMREQEMSSAEVEGRRNMLKTEKDILDTVKSKTFEALKAAPLPKREEMIGGLVKQASTIISEGYVYANAQDAPSVKRLASKYQYSGDIDCAGGLVIESLDRSQKLDLRYETLLEDLWQEKIGEVADILFK